MATIRITDSVITTIIQNASKQFEARIDAIGNATKKYLSDHRYAESVVSAWLDENGLTHVAPTLPTMFWKPVNAVQVRTINGVSMSPYSYANFGYDTKVLAAMVQDLTTTSSYQQAKMLVINNYPSLQHLADRVTECNEQTALIEDESKRFRATVRKLLDNCTTLKQALDRWPQLVELLDSELLSRHHRKVERSAKQEELDRLEIDTTALNTSLVVNKIARRIEQ